MILNQSSAYSGLSRGFLRLIAVYWRRVSVGSPKPLCLSSELGCSRRKELTGIICTVCFCSQTSLMRCLHGLVVFAAVLSQPSSRSHYVTGLAAPPKSAKEEACAFLRDKYMAEVITVTMPGEVYWACLWGPHNEGQSPCILTWRGDKLWRCCGCKTIGWECAGKLCPVFCTVPNKM